jgi:hypothetical membrane protein
MNATLTGNEKVVQIPDALKIIGIIGSLWALLTIIGASAAYSSLHPDFSPFTTYMSDIGDTPGWPQIIFNSGTLIGVPIRYLVLVLLVMRLSQLGAGRSFIITTLIIGFLSTMGTALLTATPFSVSPIVHKTGIALYFFGVVILQTVLFVKEWSIKTLPRILPLSCAFLVFSFMIFCTLMVLYGMGIVSRNVPAIWEWLSIFSSILWTLIQSILLGKPTKNLNY